VNARERFYVTVVCLCSIVAISAMAFGAKWKSPVGGAIAYGFFLVVIVGVLVVVYKEGDDDGDQDQRR